MGRRARGSLRRDEEEHEAEDGEGLSKGEAQNRDRAQHVAGLGLAGDAVDVGREDQTDGDGRTDGRETVTNEVQVATHVFPLSRLPSGKSPGGRWGIKKQHGFINYVKWMIPPGIPGWLLPLIIFLELLTFFITRPLTLALRLFGNMFAGHMLLAVFIIGGWELFNADAMMLKFVALPAWLMAFVMTLFEGLVQFLQAFVFTLLAASYFGSAVADEH